MRKRWIIPGLLAAAFSLAASGLASNGHGHGHGHGRHSYKFGPYAVASDDHGSCGNDWAADPGTTQMTIFLETKTVWHPVGV